MKSFRVFFVVLALVSGLNAFGQAYRRALLTPYQVNVSENLIPVAIFDADGTLRPALAPGAPVNHPSQVILLPDVAAKIRELNAKGYFVVIASNQAGIPKHARFDDVEAALARTIELLKAEGATVHYFDFAENWDENRKPGIGMGKRLEQFLMAAFSKPMDSTRSIMVGDAAWARAVKEIPADVRPDGRLGFNHSNADRKFAEALGVKFHEAAEYFGWRANYGVEAFEEMKDLKAFYKAHPELAPTRGCEHLLK